MNETVQHIELERIVPSKTNPREAVNGPAFTELLESVRAHGVLQPILVRSGGTFLNTAAKSKHVQGDFEIVAGHRRYEAARQAGCEQIPALVRELTDQQALELQLVENLTRADLHPLEEAHGYHQLSRQPGYDVAKVAARVGRSTKYVYDRMKLLSLTKMAQKLFLEGRFTAGHAILLARLSPTDQARAIDPDVDHYNNRQALFSDEYTLWNPDEDDRRRPRGDRENPYDGLKARSVKEFEAWIDEHVRFDAKAPDPMLFPDTVEELSTAKKVIPITYANYIPTEARDGRTYGPRSWKRADGEQGSKTCEYSVTGFVAVGPKRGDAFAVCINKDKCKVHYGAEIRTREKRRAGSPAKASRSEERMKRQEAAAAAERARAEAERARITKALPALRAAVVQRIKEAPATVSGPLGKILLGTRHARAKDVIPPGTTAEDLVRHLAYAEAVSYLYDAWAVQHHFAAIGKALDIDLKKVVDAASPLQTSAPAKTKKKAAKK